MQAQERKLRNMTQRPIAISDKPPAVSQMMDGERAYARVPGKNLRLYIRLGAKLYYTEFLPVEERDTTLVTTNVWEEME